MEKKISCILMMVLLAFAVPLAVTPAAAYEKKIPFAGEDNELTKEELVNAILPYMLDEEGVHTLDEVGDAAYVYAYWDGEPKTITDDEKVETTLYRPVERVVVAYWAPYTLLQTIKARDKVVAGLTYRFDLYPDFTDLPSIGTYYRGQSLDFERILIYQPELVFIAPGKDDYDMIKALNPNIAVVRINCYRSYIPTEYVEDTRKLGYLLDKEEEAEEFIDYYESYLDIIEEYVSDFIPEDKPRVYYEGHSRYSSGGSGSVLDWLIVSVGGKNIFSNITGSQVSAEDVIRLDPEIIFKTKYGRQGSYDATGYFVDDVTTMRDARDEIMNREELQNVTAVKEGKVYVISWYLDCCGAVGGRYFLGIAYIAKCLYPDLDLDPTAFHQEFITRFQRMDYDLSKHGTFCYHPEQFPEGK